MIVYSATCLEYCSPGHPESPDRLIIAKNYLENKFKLIIPEPATDADLEQVHTSRHIAQVKEGHFFDIDTPAYPGIYEYARLSAGGAVKAMEIGGFSLMRPPGHHAGKDYLGGFCIFNNLAVAVRKSGLSTLILDIDGHHGNGTEDIFLGDPGVVMISLHREGIYPGTGDISRENILNRPLPWNCGDRQYLETLEAALDNVSAWGFQQVAVSAGFDTHEHETMASLGLSTGAYGRIGEMVSSLGVPVFSVLEGGYVGQDLGRNIEAYLQGLCRMKTG